MFTKLREAARVAVLTAQTHITRRRYATYVYSTPWLRANYAVHTTGKTNDVMDLIVDQILENLPFEPTSKQIAAIRTNPQITILETY